MARYELIKGLPVVTMAEGKQVGKVDDLGVESVKTVGSETRVYHLSAHNVSFRRKMQLSAEERARRASNMESAQRNRRSSVDLQSDDADQGL